MTKQTTAKEKQTVIVKTKSLDEIKDSIKNSDTGFDARYILRQANKEIEELKEPKMFTSDTNYYKAMTLFEFDKGVLLLNSIPELHKVFALEFSKNLQNEYKCISPSEKSLAELITLNFVRTLAVQSKIQNLFGNNGLSKLDIQYLAILSKELDRAERHYLTSLQALRMLKMPLLTVNIKTQTAIVGQNQIVQANNNDKPI